MHFYLEEEEIQVKMMVIIQSYTDLLVPLAPAAGQPSIKDCFMLDNTLQSFLYPIISVLEWSCNKKTYVQKCITNLFPYSQVSDKTACSFMVLGVFAPLLIFSIMLFYSFLESICHYYIYVRMLGSIHFVITEGSKIRLLKALFF